MAPQERGRLGRGAGGLRRRHQDRGPLLGLSEGIDLAGQVPLFSSFLLCPLRMTRWSLFLQTLSLLHHFLGLYLGPLLSIELEYQTHQPPYIHTPLADPERYQTVFAREPGSAAAPTAGLHFTPEMLRGLEESGVEPVYVTLHVGLDTFRPLRSDDPREHTIHGEYYQVSPEAARRLAAARAEGRRIVAVGTTSVRVLEQLALGSTDVAPGTSGWTELYVLPGHQFRMVDALVTNFHLPRTTLLMLVSAFAGRDLVLEAYREAIAQEYRFYSFGDGMLIV